MTIIERKPVKQQPEEEQFSRSYYPIKSIDKEGRGEKNCIPGSSDASSLVGDTSTVMTESSLSTSTDADHHRLHHEQHINLLNGTASSSITTSVAGEPRSSSSLEISTAASSIADSAVLEPPSVTKILHFALPAIGVWLCNPLLSLIDTSFVGILAGTTQQAAMHPAVSVTDYSTLLAAFLYTGTTNLIATARECDRSIYAKSQQQQQHCLEMGITNRGDGGKSGSTTRNPKTTAAAMMKWKSTGQTLIGVLQIAWIFGICLGTFVYTAAPTLLRLLMGGYKHGQTAKTIDPFVFEIAIRFVRIRAMGIPAASVIGTAQAACLGMQDIWSPLVVLIAAALINISGDILWVGAPFHFGAAGSAWGTVISQYVAMILLLRWLCHDNNHNHKNPKSNIGASTNDEKSKTSKNSSSTSTRYGKDSFSVKGFLRENNGFRGIQDLVRYSMTSSTSKSSMIRMIQQLRPFVVPVTATQIGRVSGYLAMSYAVSSRMGTISMASQQVIVSLFYCLCPIADSLSLTAQSFIPPLLTTGSSSSNSNSESGGGAGAGGKTIIHRRCALTLRRALTNFMISGMIFGCVLAGCVQIIPYMTRFFTADPAVMVLVQKVTPLLSIWFVVHGVLCSTEGMLLGQKDLKFLGGMYAFYFFAVPFCILKMTEYTTAAATSTSTKSDTEAGITSSSDTDAVLSNATIHPLVCLWQVFTAYQLSRVTLWVVRALYIQRKTERTSMYHSD